MKKQLFLLFLMLPFVAVAQNPIIRNQFAADPTARVFNDRIYVYPSHDISAPEGQRQDWFCMADYHVFSSENLTDWTDHGVILSQEQVPWGKPDGYSMWAPDCVSKNGKYYFYFPDAPRDGRGFAIGVATADSPEGPFMCEPKPIQGITGIDPCVLLDDDGSAYIYWSGMGIRGAKLRDDMLEVDGDLETVEMPQGRGSFQIAGKNMDGLPEGFKEGPFVFKREGWYYLTFPWVRAEGGTETLAYAVSKSPLGPWDFKGIFMAEHVDHCWTNHHSFLQYRGEWYLFYHHNDYSPSFDKRRSARIERVLFNKDGTIQEVKPTKRGVGINQATDKIEIDCYSAVSEGVFTQFVDSADTFKGWYCTLPKKNSWVKYNDISFDCLDEGYVIVCAKAEENTEFCLRDKKAKGKVVATLKMTVLSEQGPFRRDMRGQWLTLTAPLNYIPKGVTDLFITCEGAPVSVDWIQFKNRPKYFSVVPKGSLPAYPDSAGFIRRWLLQEPIPKSIPSNTVFTDSYLRNTFTEELVKLGKQKSKSYALESQTYNVRLFRFGELWANQTYGSFFWATTIIDCEEEIPNVRLAVGCNGASMWWLNEEEVLLLSGDRRMVEDDAMSPRLTLKKGRNLLRCALVNGPGLSDFCVRFLDEKNKPITNYTIIAK